MQENNKEKIKVTIDGKEVVVENGSTILEAAKHAGVDIPTLCHLDYPDIKFVNRSSSCRICVVEVEGRRNLAPACSTPATDGIVVKTNTIRVLEARKTVLELFISNHPAECLTCAKSGQCELQELAERFGLTEITISGDSHSEYPKDYSRSIIRNMDKCIMCRRCETMCNTFQSVGVLSAVFRGFNAVVSPAFQVPMDESICTHCGQCVAVCPVGALTEKDQTWKVVEALADPDKIVLVQTAPAIRVTLGEEFGYEPGTIVKGKMVAALRRLGFDYVFDTDFAADVTIVEEATELLERIQRHLDGDDTVKLPILTSCCPAWVNFIESQFPELVGVPSTARSPQQMFGSITKTYLAEKLGIPREKMIVVSIMPCLTKKFEASRHEFLTDGIPDVDISISTRELAHLIKKANIEFDSLPDEEFDKPLGESTGAAVIFGTTGGVIEAATRTAVEWYTGEPLKNIDFEQLRGLDGIRVASVQAGDLTLNIGIAHGLSNARKLLEEIQSGNPRNLHAIEIMACPGGCIGGGGQPFHRNDIDVLTKRNQAIYQLDKDLPIRKSHENPFVIEMYETYMGKPMGFRAYQFLHTEYYPKQKV